MGLLAGRQNILEVCYNIQTFVDDLHNLPIDFKTTNNNDTHALGNMTARAKSILGHNDFFALLDKGYHTGSEINRCHEMDIETLVAVPSLSIQAPDPVYNLEQFIYQRDTDTYQCPQGNSLFTNGSWYNRRNKDAIDWNRQLYKRRQEIVEHPFGTIKRQWGFDYTLMKGKQKVDGEVGLIFISYLFRRLITILGINGLMEAVLSIKSFYFDLMKTIKHIKINSEALQSICIFPIDFRRYSLNNP